MNLSVITPHVAKLHYQSSVVDLYESFSPAGISAGNPGKFIYTLVHEMRNPLTNINLAIELLKGMDREEDRKIYLDMITRNAGRIKAMVDDLLISRNTNGIKAERHSVQYLLEEILMINEDRLMLNNVRVRKTYSTQELKIKFDRPAVKIALANIIINAIEAMPVENGLLEISTKLLHGVCFIVIKDNGAGISKGDLHNIFKPYFTNKPGGMGLGLAGTLSALHASHIGVNVRSEPGKGTRFILACKKESVQLSPYASPPGVGHVHSTFLPYVPHSE